MKRPFTLLSSLVAAATIAASASTLGFCDGSVSRDKTFRMGSTELQGIAIRLDSDKLQLLKGHTISAVSSVFGSSHTTDGNAYFFVSTAPDATPLASTTAKVSRALQWATFNLDTPYTITGDEGELYIGYTAKIATSANLLSADYTADAHGLSYVYNNGSWSDTYGLGTGSANIRFEIDMPDFTDVVLKPIAVEGYFKGGESYTFAGELFNFGTTAVNALDINLSVGGESKSLSLTGLNIAPASTYGFELPEVTTSLDGLTDITIEVSGVNGETAVADNAFTSGIFFYPAVMERSLLLEGFTGQACSNCPAGHSTIAAFCEDYSGSPIIEVMHHSGYQPDYFSMDADYDYTFFYGSPSTFAPAMMLNRAHYTMLGEVPVLNVSNQLLTDACRVAEEAQPYVSLKLATTYDPATRLVSVDVQAYNHNELPADANVLNVMLVQDGLQGRQTGAGDGYVHDAVMRGVLTGNSWGVNLADKSLGGENRWSTEFTLPEAIFSDFWASQNLTDEQKQRYTHAAVAENMRVVAYVGSFHASDFNAHQVYNAVEAPLGESYTQSAWTSGIEAVSVAAKAPEISVVDGRILVAGTYDSLAVYTVNGVAVNPASALAPGLYIVRVANAGAVAVKKILVK